MCIYKIKIMIFLVQTSSASQNLLSRLYHSKRSQNHTLSSWSPGLPVTPAKTDWLNTDLCYHWLRYRDMMLPRRKIAPAKHTNVQCFITLYWSVQDCDTTFPMTPNTRLSTGTRLVKSWLPKCGVSMGAKVHGMHSCWINRNGHSTDQSLNQISLSFVYVPISAFITVEGQMTVSPWGLYLNWLWVL